MNETLLTIIVVVTFTAILTFFSLKNKNDSWSGFLLEKKKKTYKDDNDIERNTFTLVFKTDTGKTKKMNVDEVTFNKYEENKKYVKEKGNYFPKEK